MREAWSLSVATSINLTRSIDFIHEQRDDGICLQLINVIDDFNRDALSIEIDFKLPSKRVIRPLGQLIEWRGKPAASLFDRGPEKIRGAVKAWAARRQIRIDYNQSDKPLANAYFEWVNRTVRYEWLSPHYCNDLAQVQLFSARWMYDDKHDRLNMALGSLIPK